ncbi:hypothetical protein AB9P05_04660 [Roseivirga sp. BDSF3-8]|uniref:hypothetical protein n=1 Tax=Roseivirga sp. BDSF3-8 TaxID=3241598 RepID=UPI0035327C5B
MKTKFERLSDSTFEKLSDERKNDVKGGGDTYMSIWTADGGGGGGGTTIASAGSLTVSEETYAMARMDTVKSDDSPSEPVLV